MPPPVSWAAVARCVAARLPDRLHSVRTWQVPGAVALGGYWQVPGAPHSAPVRRLAVSVGCRAAYRSLAVADSGAFGRYVVVGARTARCAGVRGHCTRRVLPAFEVAVLGGFL